MAPRAGKAVGPWRRPGKGAGVMRVAMVPVRMMVPVGWRMVAMAVAGEPGPGRRRTRRPEPRRQELRHLPRIVREGRMARPRQVPDRNSQG